MDLHLARKKVLISGGTKGIGRAVTLAFGCEGADVAVFGRHDLQKDCPTTQLKNEGRKASFCRVDIRHENQVISGVKQVIEEFGRIDIFVNCAGVLGYEPVTKITSHELHRIIETNTMGVVFVTREVAKHMVSRKQGSIVLIGSTIQFNPSYAESSYRISKAGVQVFAETAALELAPYGIRVNCVSPCLTNSPNFLGDVLKPIWADEKRKEKLLRAFPLGRIGEPEDIAPAVLFLASDQTGYITGANLVVDGGFKLRPLILKTKDEILKMNLPEKEEGKSNGLAV